MIIYKIENNNSGNIYIGKTTRNLSERINEHFRQKKTPISKALRKYGLDGFTITIIDNAENNESLAEKEIFWIKELNCKVPNGYNLTDGGEGVVGYQWTDEQKAKMSLSSTGRKMSPECIAKRVASQTGLKRSPEARRRMSAACKGRGKGRKQSPESIQKRVAKIIGRKNTPETIAKMKEAAKGRVISEEQKRKDAWTETITETIAKRTASRLANRLAKQIYLLQEAA